ncbi:hypothetical protein AAE478_000457 [Parahypoxylon ruwenzoriense]
MTVPNPLQFFIFPFVFFVTLPLAICAGFTTILAFMVLFLRLFLVYFDVGLETLRYVVLGHDAHNHSIASPQTPSTTRPASPEFFSPPPSPGARNRRRRKRQSGGSNGSVTPVDGFGLAPSIGLERDFEGVGGWRLESANVDADAADAADDQQWYNLNSRLEIPDRRHHYRSRSGGAVLSGNSSSNLYTKDAYTTAAYSPEGPTRVYASPNSSRLRTPSSGRPHGIKRLDEDGYFPLLEGEAEEKKR